MPINWEGALEAYRGNLEQTAVARALALIESSANGVCPGVPGVLSRSNRSKTVRLADERRAAGVPVVGNHRISARRLGAWPITGLTSVTLDGVDVTTQFFFERLAIVRSFDHAPVPPFASLSVQFVTGYNPDNLSAWPPLLQLAVLTLAHRILAGLELEGAGSFTLGDFSQTDSSSNLSEPLPADIAAMIAPWRLETYG